MSLNCDLISDLKMQILIKFKLQLLEASHEVCQREVEQNIFRWWELGGREGENF